MSRTIVIGAGVAGLATAALLAHEGHHVQILERNDRVGGRAGTTSRGGFRFDTGPSWYLMPSAYEHFFNLLGTTIEEQLDLRTLDPGYRVFQEPDTTGSEDAPRARSIAVPFGADRTAEVFERTEKHSGQALHRYLASAAHTEAMAEKYFLYNPFTAWRSLAAADILRAVPKLATLLGTTLQTFISKRFSDPLLQQVLGYPAVFLGTDPSRAPAIYHMMSALDLDTGVQYPMGGFWRLIERLESLALDADVEITTGAEVTEILTEHGSNGLTVSGVRWRDTGGVEHVQHANTVVSGADLHHTETALLPPKARSYPASWWQKKESGPGAVIALLGVKGALPELEHHSLFFTRNWHENFDAIFGQTKRVPDPASIYVCKPSATDPSVAPEGHENVFVLIPVPANTEIGVGGPDRTGSPAVEQAVDAAIRQIAEWANIPGLKERIVVRETLGPADFENDYHAWQGGMLGPAHILRQSAFFRAQNESKKVAGLYYAGATTAPGVGVPMCFISAELVLKRIRGDHSPGPLPVPVRAEEKSA